MLRRASRIGLGATVAAVMALATTAAMSVMGLSGERAAETARGPGSFQMAFLDELHAITPEELARKARPIAT